MATCNGRIPSDDLPTTKSTLLGNLLEMFAVNSPDRYGLGRYERTAG